MRASQNMTAKANDGGVGELKLKQMKLDWSLIEISWQQELRLLEFRQKTKYEALNHTKI